MVVVTPDVLSSAERARLRREWEQRFAGIGGAHRLAILEGPATVEVLPPLSPARPPVVPPLRSYA